MAIRAAENNVPAYARQAPVINNDVYTNKRHRDIELKSYYSHEYATMESTANWYRILLVFIRGLI